MTNLKRSRTIVALGLLLGLAPLTGREARAQAAVSHIRYFVAATPSNPSLLYEVIDGAPGGGRLVKDGRWEVIPGPTAGVSIGYTDRASRGEPIVTQVLGVGVVDSLQVRTNNTVLVNIPYVPLPTPGNRQFVSTDPNVDNINVAAVVRSKVIAQRRVPVGTRPR